ncbi:MAG: branched-chain amino acid ABC transporter permease [Elusimicrobiota bacterium]
MGIEQILQYFFSGITIGIIYAITAIGFNIIYNTTGIINFAQGEFLMIGAMTAITLNQFMPLPLAVLCAVIITALLGAVIELLFFRWLNNPAVLRMIIITIGLSIVMRELALHIWGRNVQSLPYFTGDECSSINIFGAYISPQVLWVLGICCITVIALTLFFKYTLIGQSMRACAVNRTAARLCGVNAKNMVTLSFILSAAIGALAGCVISPITQTRYDCGTAIAIKGFTVAILGGLGNSTAAVVAGLLLGLIESYGIILMPLAYIDAISIVIMLAILFVRPGGLFGNKEALRLQEF